MSDKIIAFMDLLGFRNFTRQDKISAIGMLQDYVTVLTTKKIEDILHHPDSHPMITKELAKRKSIYTFNYFVPFSDSIFIVSSGENPSMFLTQLGNFVLEAFLLGQLGLQNQSKKDFPVLFRVGIEFGDIELIKAPLIDNEQIDNKIPIPVGKPVIEAVGMVDEKRIRCPDILLGPCLIEKITDIDFKKKYIENHGQNNRLLWPAFIYEPDPNKFLDIFSPAVYWWKYYSHTNYSDIYFNFLKLIIKSTISVFCDTSEYNIKTYINNQINNLGITSKRDALWED